MYKQFCSSVRGQVCKQRQQIFSTGIALPAQLQMALAFGQLRGEPWVSHHGTAVHTAAATQPAVLLSLVGKPLRTTRMLKREK